MRTQKRCGVVAIFIFIGILWAILGAFNLILAFDMYWEENFETYALGLLTSVSEKWDIVTPGQEEYMWVSEDDSFNGDKSGYTDTSDQAEIKIIQYNPENEIDSGFHQLQINIKNTYWYPTSASEIEFAFIGSSRSIRVGLQSDEEKEDYWLLATPLSYKVDCDTGEYLEYQYGERETIDDDTLFGKNVWGRIFIEIDFEKHVVKISGNNGVENTNEVCVWFQNDERDITLTTMMLFYSGRVTSYFDYFSQIFPEVEAGVWAISPDFGIDPEAFWRFDEGTGDTAYDSSGNAHTGTLEESMTEEDCVEGVVETALDFDGNDDYVDCGDFADGLTSLTLSAWIYKPSFADDYEIIIKKDGGAIRNDRHFYLATMSGNEARFWILTDEGVMGISGGALSINTWYYIAGTWDGTDLKLYINDEEVNSGSRSGTMLSSDEPVQIGGDDIGAFNFFTGKIDEARIYTEALTHNQISSLYKNPTEKITDLETIFEFGWKDLNNWDTLLVTFEHRNSGIFSGAKVFEIETIGADGSMELTFDDFNFDRNGKFYFYAVASKLEVETIEDMFLTGGYSYAWSDDLVAPQHWYIINIEGLIEIFEMVDFEDWYTEISKFATPTAMFSAVAGHFEPVFDKIGEFGNRIKDYFNLEEVYSQGYEIGKTMPYFAYFVGQVSLFLGGFPILKWVFVIVLLLAGIFVFRLVLKFIPFLGG